MTLSEKLEILIRRKNTTKTDFAVKIGITYRALANYISGDRIPRRYILVKMAKELDVTADFLLNDKQSLILDSRERFIFNATSEEKGVNAALSLLGETEKVFKSGDLTDADKQALYSCMTEVYFGAKTNQDETM